METFYLQQYFMHLARRIMSVYCTFHSIIIQERFPFVAESWFNVHWWRCAGRRYGWEIIPAFTPDGFLFVPRPIGHTHLIGWHRRWKWITLKQATWCQNYLIVFQHPAIDHCPKSYTSQALRYLQSENLNVGTNDSDFMWLQALRLGLVHEWFISSTVVHVSGRLVGPSLQNLKMRLCLES